MDSLFNDQDTSLDEVLAFIDSTDFDLLTTNAHNVDNTGVVDWVETQDTPASTTLALPGNQDIVNQGDPVHQIQDKDNRPTKVERSSTSCDVNGCTAPYKEHGRVRDRVIRLRGVVKQLEQQLESLNTLKNRELGDEFQHEGDTLTEKQSTGTDINVTWHQLALRQFKARREAEKENMNLRERLQEHIRVARRLESLI